MMTLVLTWHLQVPACGGQRCAAYESMQHGSEADIQAGQMHERLPCLALNLRLQVSIAVQ